MSRRARLARVLVAGALVAVTSAPVTAAAAPGGAGGTRAPIGSGARCAWPIRADRETLNIAYPDTAATYWFQRYSFAPGESVLYRWTRPGARYSSFVVYDAAGNAIGHQSDRTRGLDGRTRSTHIVIGAIEDGDDTIVTAPIGTNGRSEGSIIYRVYVPDRAGEPAGGVPLPRATLIDAAAGRTRLPACDRPVANPDVAATVDRMASITGTPVPASPVFIRPRGDGATLYPNPDNTYVATIVDHRPGRVVVIRGRAPTFPDTRAGEPIRTSDQLRYWSFCTNEYAKPYRTSACRYDAQVATRRGDYTIVVSTRADRPVGLRARDGETWLPWGSTAVPSLILMREMLPAPEYAQAAARLAPGQPAVAVMGEYAPRAVYCRRTTFERGGAAACGL
jgi:hypothetical protein